jgi:diguanylate cyclase (GGDEF)-like protein/PAS domain S-box-containing protein
MRDVSKPHLVTENAGPARHQGRTAVHLDPPEAERRRRDRATKAADIRYRRLFESAPDAILVLDAETGVVVDVNPAVCRLLALESRDILGQPLWRIRAFKNAAATRAQFSDVVRQPHMRYDDLPLETQDGQIRHVELVSTLFLADSKQFVQCTLHDITDRVQRERADGERAQQETLQASTSARRAAADETHDRTTGFVNRRYLDETLPRELHRAARAKTPLSVTVLAADSNAPIDDTLLREVGRVVREHLRKSDMAARYSDREFVLVLPESSPKATLERVNQIRSRVQRLELYHGGQRLTAPVLRQGVAVAGQDGTTAQELLHAARARAQQDTHQHIRSEYA